MRTHPIRYPQHPEFQVLIVVDGIPVEFCLLRAVLHEDITLGGLVRQAGILAFISTMLLRLCCRVCVFDLLVFILLFLRFRGDDLWFGRGGRCA